MKYFLDRLRERSTWEGLVALAMGLGLTLSPELSSAIVALGVSLVGVLRVLTKDK